MRKFLTILILFTFKFTILAQCPSVSYIQVDACNGTGNEQNNEFFMINSGDGFNVNDLGFTTPTGGVMVTSSNNSDFNATNPCPTCAGGTCTFNFVTNGGMVPENQDVIVFTSNQLNFIYDFTGLCSTGTLYILVANSAPTQGQFANYNTNGSPNGCSGCTDIGTSDDRSMTLTEAGGCTTTVTYNRCRLLNINGTCSGSMADGASVVFTSGVAGYNNNGCAAPSLPIVLKNFICRIGIKTSKISFSTASETNNDYFTIERSGDGVAYEAIGEIKGAGNSSKELSYEFTDEKPLTGLNYYRIKQTDFDGKYSYSEVRSVRFTDGASVTVSPRTTEGRVDITTDMEDYNVEVYTAAGAQVKAFTGMNADQSISIEDLKAGIYFLRVSSTSTSETVRVIKL